jgi:hypothetical protein
VKLLGPEDTAKALRDKAQGELALARSLAQILEGCPELADPLAAAGEAARTTLEGWKSKGLPADVQTRLDALAGQTASLDRSMQLVGLLAGFFAGLPSEQLDESWTRARRTFTSPWMIGPSGTSESSGHEVGSILRALELLFGLPRGRDVQGRCAELVFALEWLLAQQGDASSPLCMLGALAGEVASGRATLLEVALVMTMNAYSTYAVGCYGTLYPLGDADPRKPAPGFDAARLAQAKRDIQAALAGAEQGRLLLLCFETRDASRREALHALACESEAEREQFRSYALLTPTRYNAFALRRRLDVALRDQARFTSSTIASIVADMTRKDAAWLEQVAVMEGT